MLIAIMFCPAEYDAIHNTGVVQPITKYRVSPSGESRDSPNISHIPIAQYQCGLSALPLCKTLFKLSVECIIAHDQTRCGSTCSPFFCGLTCGLGNPRITRQSQVVVGG